MNLRLLTILMLMTVAFPMQTLAQETPDFIEAITSDELLSFLYPAEWMLVSDEDSSSILLLSNEVILEKTEADIFVSGDASIVLSFYPSDYASFLGLVGESLEEKLFLTIQALETLHTDEDGISRLSFGELDTFEATEENSAMARVSYSLEGQADGILLIWDVSDDLLGTAILNTAPNELADHESIVMTIVQSIEFTGSIEDLLNEAQNGDGS